MARAVVKAALRLLARLLFRVRVEGNVDVSRGERLLVIANHESLLDGLILGLFLPLDPVFVVHTGVARSLYMGIDPASPHCDAFYELLAKLELPLITHAGAELAVLGGDGRDYGNPLRLRRALDHGVTTIVAHCASFGNDRDTDRGANGPQVRSFQLFARLMDDPRYAGRLFGDVSAVTQVNRMGAAKEILARSDWHARLLNGSDYPLPGVMPLVSPQRLVELNLLDAAVAEVVSSVRRHNALLFDFLLKRHMRYDGKRLPRSVFETRRFFDRRIHV